MGSIQVSEKDLSQFENAVAIACALKSDKRIEHQGPAKIDRAARPLPSSFLAQDGSLAISFDRSWYPFLSKVGDEHAAPKRWYIPKVSWLLAQIARALQAPRQRSVGYVGGGQVFLDGAGVRRTPTGHAEIAVLQWSLPRASQLLRPRPDSRPDSEVALR